MKTIVLHLVAAIVAAGSLVSATPAFIPLPAKVESGEGRFTVDETTTIVAPASLTNEATQLADRLRRVAGLPAPIAESGRGIVLGIDPRMPREGYSLAIEESGVTIRGGSNAGVFHGIQTFLQCLPAAIYGLDPAPDTDWSAPCLTIVDKPRFAWRAFMLDEARHFKGGREVRKLLDRMAELKMNVFHWHLTDDQGWRIEIRKYPRLTEVGSKRRDTQVGGWDSPARSGVPHEGFYTQEQIREIVAYAAERHITIVPEIGMPGHACAAIASYPRLGTNKKPIEVMTTFGKAADVYDPSDEYVYEFLSDVLDEIVELFPSKIIHIGGDEVKFEQWQNSASVGKLMKEKGLDTMADVQIHFTNRMAEIVQKKGRNIMGWNEILGDDLHGFLKDGQTAKAATLDPGTIIHFWAGSPDMAKRAIRNGHRIVNSWSVYTYLDYSYASIPLAKAYGFEPVFDGLSEEEERRVIGTGCQMWGEWIPTVADMESKVYPRIAAYAEVGWTPKENKDFSSFKERMREQLKRWDFQGIAHARDELDKVTAQDFFNHLTVDSWTPDSTPSEWTTVEISTDGRISRPGTYEVVFLYSRGAHALQISEVALLRDGVEIDIDKHDGFSGNNLMGIVYKLRLDKVVPGAKLTLSARVMGSGGTDSAGDVRIKQID